MDSKVIIILAFALFFSCKRADDAWNKIVVENATRETIVLNFRRVGGTIDGFGHKIYPNDKLIYATALYTSGYGIIEDNWGKNGDTISIYRNDTLLVKWGAPLDSLPDSIHSFYNKNSWKITNGGHDNKYEIATFTITEDDLKQADK